LFLGQVLRDVGQQIEAIHEFQQALDIREKLAHDNPLVPRYQMDQGFVLIELGALRQARKELKQAMDCYYEARGIYENVSKRDGNSSQVRLKLAQSFFLVGVIQGMLDRRPEEYQSLTQARDLDESLVKLDPNNLAYRYNLSQALNNLGSNRKT